VLVGELLAFIVGQVGVVADVEKILRHRRPKCVPEANGSGRRHRNRMKRRLLGDRATAVRPWFGAVLPLLPPLWRGTVLYAALANRSAARHEGLLTPALDEAEAYRTAEQVGARTPDHPSITFRADRAVRWPTQEPVSGLSAAPCRGFAAVMAGATQVGWYEEPTR
jgi:hypothetical protein